MARDRYKFHHFFYFRILMPVFLWWLGSHFEMTYPETPELPDHFLLISNHVTNFDPFLIGTSLRRHMYLVATEHLFRMGFVSKLIRFLADKWKE